MATPSIFNLQRKHRQRVPSAKERRNGTYFPCSLPFLAHSRALCTSLTRSPLHRPSPRAYDRQSQRAARSSETKTNQCTYLLFLLFSSCVFVPVCFVSAPRILVESLAFVPFPSSVSISNFHTSSQRPRSQSLPLSCTSPRAPLIHSSTLSPPHASLAHPYR